MTVFNGVIRKKNDCDLLTSSDLDLGSRSLKIWSIDGLCPTIP